MFLCGSFTNKHTLLNHGCMTCSSSNIILFNDKKATELKFTMMSHIYGSV